MKGTTMEMKILFSWNKSGEIYIWEKECAPHQLISRAIN